MVVIIILLRSIHCIFSIFFSNCLFTLEEIDPTQEIAEQDILGMAGDEFSLFKDLAGSLPGIDEAMSFGEVMRCVSLISSVARAPRVDA